MTFKLSDPMVSRAVDWKDTYMGEIKSKFDGSCHWFEYAYDIEEIETDQMLMEDGSPVEFEDMNNLVDTIKGFFTRIDP